MTQPSPRCPKCGSSNLTLRWNMDRGHFVKCDVDSTHCWNALEIADFAQFFAPNQAEQVVRCHTCKSTLIYDRLANGELEIFHTCNPLPPNQGTEEGEKVIVPCPACHTPCSGPTDLAARFTAWKHCEGRKTQLGTEEGMTTKTPYLACSEFGDPCPCCAAGDTSFSLEGVAGKFHLKATGAAGGVESAASPPIGSWAYNAAREICDSFPPETQRMQCEFMEKTILRHAAQPRLTREEVCPMCCKPVFEPGQLTPEEVEQKAREIVQEITDDMLTRHRMGYSWPGTFPMQEIIVKHLTALSLQGQGVTALPSAEELARKMFETALPKRNWEEVTSPVRGSWKGDAERALAALNDLQARKPGPSAEETRHKEAVELTIRCYRCKAGLIWDRISTKEIVIYNLCEACKVSALALDTEEAARKPVSRDKSRCSLCGASRIPINRERTEFGACTFVDCKDPAHDYNLEQARKPLP